MKSLDLAKKEDGVTITAIRRKTRLVLQIFLDQRHESPLNRAFGVC